MIGKRITCRNATLYSGMLTRGKSYKVLAVDEEKQVVKLVCDNGRTRLFAYSCFDFEGKPVHLLVDWVFDDNPEEAQREDYLTWVEVSFNLTDGTRRWCKIITPEGLQRVLQQPEIGVPGIYIPHLIIVRSYDKNDVDRVLKYLDENDELISVSLLLEDDNSCRNSIHICSCFEFMLIHSNIKYILIKNKNEWLG